MRNLKRALSLALASVMLLGMMVVGSSAAFADADEIVNTEAVEIAAGLGLFAGSDGKFNPEGTVTRAQMAAVIAKMYYGSDLNADTYKGSNQFSDTASFEGGWAEGYINLGVEKGWFKGYGDGTFKPGQAVTTAEAMTMIINLLGIDAGEGTWPMTVMAAAEENELFDGELELKPQPATNVAMTRDELAVVVVNALYYSEEGVLGYAIGGKEFKDFGDAVAYVQQINAEQGAGTLSVANITELKADTLAADVFELQPVYTGYITGNQATGADATVIDGGLQVNLETGLDMLGHYVSVYYAERFVNEKNPGVAYAIVDQADYIVVDEAIAADKKDFVAAFGTTTINLSTNAYAEFDNAGAYAGGALTVGFEDATATSGGTAAFTAAVGTYAIDKENGELVGYLAPIAFTIEEVITVKTTAGKEAIRISNHAALDNNADDDVVVEYDGIAEGDIVVAKTYQGTVTYLEKVEVVTGKINKTKTDATNSIEYTYIDGKEYVNGDPTRVGSGVPMTTAVVAGGTGRLYDFDAQISGTTTYDAYLYGGKLYGVSIASGTAALADTIYVVSNYSVDAAGTYGANTRSFYAQGVNAEGKEVSILIGMANVTVSAGVETETMIDDVNDGGTGVNNIAARKTLPVKTFYTFEKSQDKDMAKKDIMTAKAAANKSAFDAVNSVEQFFADSYTVPGAGLVINKDLKSLNTTAGAKAYFTADTKFVVIDNTTYNDELEAATYTGIMNKTLTSADTVRLVVTEDAEENYIVSMLVVETAATVLDAADLIYVLDAPSAVGAGKFEYEVYMTETNKVTKIIADAGTYAVGIYDSFTLDPEDNVYNLGTVISADNTQVKLAELLSSTYGNAISSSAITDVELAADAAIVDLRSEENLEDAEVSEITSLNELKAALKGNARVYFNAVIDNTGAEPVITHIFVYSVQVETYKGAGDWHESNL